MGFDCFSTPGVESRESAAVGSDGEDESGRAAQREEGMRDGGFVDARGARETRLLDEFEARLEVGVDQPTCAGIREIAFVDQESEELGMFRDPIDVFADRSPDALPGLGLRKRGEASVESLGQPGEEPVRGGAPEPLLVGEVVGEEGLCLGLLEL